MASEQKFSVWDTPYSSKISVQLFMPPFFSMGQIPKDIIYHSSKPEFPTV